MRLKCGGGGWGTEKRIMKILTHIYIHTDTDTDTDTDTHTDTHTHAVDPNAGWLITTRTTGPDTAMAAAKTIMCKTSNKSVTIGGGQNF
jgi:hypothetical protein